MMGSLTEENNPELHCVTLHAPPPSRSVKSWALASLARAAPEQRGLWRTATT